MINNTLGVQGGRDPVTASMKFYWNGTGDSPQAYFTTEDDTWLWPSSGVMVGQKLLIFLMHLERADKGLGFKVVGNQAVLVSNPQSEPNRWKCQPVEMPEYRFPVLFGSGESTVDSKHLYSFCPEVSLGHNAYLVRWPLADVLRCDLRQPQWFDKNSWKPQSQVDALPAPILPHAQTEFSVLNYLESKTCLQVQCSPHLSAKIGIRFAHHWHGPWSELSYLFDPRQQSGRHEGVFFYSARAHPYLESEGLSVTYCSNSRDLSRVVYDEAIYYPRFIRILFH